MPRTEMARRPPKAENRAHIPRAIASREAMLWQGCSLSPRELEIVRESREANRTDFARIPSDGLRDAPRASTDGLARFLSDKLRSRSRASIGRTHIRNPLARFPTDGLARIRKADADSTISQPRYGRNQPPLNHEPTNRNGRDKCAAR